MPRPRQHVTDEREFEQYIDMVDDLRLKKRMTLARISRAAGVAQCTLRARINSRKSVTLEALYAMRHAYSQLMADR